MRLVPKFEEDTDGTATIDWVVLLGALTLLGIGLMDEVKDAMRTHVANIEAELERDQFRSTWLDETDLPLGP